MMSASIPNSATASPPRRRLRWYQYRLRSLLILMLLTAVLFGGWNLYIAPFIRQGRAMERLRVIPAISTEYAADVRAEPALPGWLQWIPGSGRLVHVTFVKLEHCKVKDEDLACLDDLPDVERLYLAATNVSDAGVQHVRGLAKLRRLSLWGTRVTDRGMENLRSLDNLEALDLNQTAVSDRGIECLGGLANLASLTIWETAATESSLEILGQLPNLRKLSHHITLSDSGIETLRRFRYAQEIAGQNGFSVRHMTDRGMSDLQTFGSIEGLSIADSSVTSAGWAGLARLSKISSFRLSDSPFTLEGLQVLFRLPRLTNPSLVRPTGVTFGDVALAWSSKTTSLMIGPHEKSKTDRYVRCTDKGRMLEIVLPIGDDELAGLGGFSDVTSIGISGFGSAGLAHLAEVPQLESLNLSAQLDDSSLSVISHLPKLRRLTIGAENRHEPISNACVRPLADAKQLEELCFSNVPLSDEQLAFVAGLPNLRRLRICDDKQIAGSFFVNLRELPALEELSLINCTNVADDSLSHLAPLKTLKHLALQHTAVTDAGLAHLYGLPLLEDVTVIGSKATDQGRAKLRNNLPKARSVY